MTLKWCCLLAMTKFINQMVLKFNTRCPCQQVGTFFCTGEIAMTVCQIYKELKMKKVPMILFRVRYTNQQCRTWWKSQNFRPSSICWGAVQHQMYLPTYIKLPIYNPYLLPKEYRFCQSVTTNKAISLKLESISALALNSDRGTTFGAAQLLGKCLMVWNSVIFVTFDIAFRHFESTCLFHSVF